MWFKKRIEESEPLIKNAPPKERRKDFRLQGLGLGLALLVALFAVAGMAMGAGPRGLSAPGARELGLLAGFLAGAFLVLSFFPRWSAVLKLALLALLGFFGLAEAEAGRLLPYAAIGLILAPSLQRAEEWERAIVLRLGKFHAVRGPGLFLMLPLADRVAKTVDLRIRVTDFAAETTLTRDSVTVTVDALCFWLVWDAEKAVCEVQDYVDAVILSSKTALRNAVSKNDLSTFLEKGDEIEEQIRAEVDRKTTEWGITVQHIEITDIQIPEALQDSMSRLAQAEREKRSRILLAEAEIEIAHRLEEAARIYSSDDIAMKLKNLSILNEGLKAGNSMMLVPNSITEELRSDEVFGLQALNEGRAREAKARRRDRAGKAGGKEAQDETGRD